MKYSSIHLFFFFQGQGDQKEKKRKESILDLSKYLEKQIRVKFAGGREASGILKGYDPLLNLVLDSTTEYLRGMNLSYSNVNFCISMLFGSVHEDEETIVAVSKSCSFFILK